MRGTEEELIEKLLDDDIRTIRQWVLNDEILYQWWRPTKMSISAFIRKNRKKLDAHIRGALGK